MAVEGHVNAPNRVIDQLTTDSQFITDGFLAVVHHRTTDVEILVKGVVQIQSQQRLALHIECRLILKRYTDVGTGIDNALVGDSDCTHGIVHGVVTVLGQGHTSSGHDNRTTCHIGGVKSDDTTRTRLILTSKYKLVFITELLRDSQSRVIEFSIDIVLGYVRIVEFGIEVFTKGFSHREYHLTCG